MRTTPKDVLTTMVPHVTWTAQLNHVRDASLLGSAELSFWRDRLAGEELTPVDRVGRTNILIVSAAGRFMGVRFRELSVSVIVSSVAVAAETTSCFLVRAFNSNRFFTFCERRFFSTPYDYADVEVVHDIPTAITVTQHGRTFFQASMQRGDTPTTRTPTHVREEALVARIMLPSRMHSTRRQRKMFFARISGNTHVYPFMAGEDTVVIHPQADGDVFHTLLESDFLPEQWIVRSNAAHAKSRTYNRGEIADMERLAVGEPNTKVPT